MKANYLLTNMVMGFEAGLSSRKCGKHENNRVPDEIRFKILTILRENIPISALS